MYNETPTNRAIASIRETPSSVKDIGRQDPHVYYSQDQMIAIYVVGKTYKRDIRPVSEGFRRMMRDFRICGYSPKATYFNFSDSPYTMGMMRFNESDSFLELAKEYTTNLEQISKRHPFNKIMTRANRLLFEQRASVLPRNQSVDKEPLCGIVLDYYMNSTVTK